MPYKKARVPKYLILEDTNPPNHRRYWSWALSLFLLLLITTIVLI